MTVPGKLSIDANGRLTGPARIDYNSPWPCPNGTPGGGASVMRGLIFHTMVGNLPGTIATFNNPAKQVSAHLGIDQSGRIHQFGPFLVNWEAWAQMAGNPDWYSCEMADDGDPRNPYTAEQIASGAQVAELLSRPGAGNFPLQVTDSVDGMGLGTHLMGGAAWGAHTCPGPGPRAGQRAAIIALAKQIRNPPPPPPVLEMIGVQLPGGQTRKFLSHDGGKNWA